MKETEQTLFLKSNLLHIRTNEGEFEVSNQNELHYDEEEDAFILNGTKSINWEWPGGVEFETIAPHPECYKARECLQLTNGLNCSQAYDARTRSTSLCAKAYKLARLIPEEKKEFKPAQPTPNFPKGGTTFTESAYKEFEKFDLNKNNFPTIATDRTEVESPEPQEKGHDCEFFLVTDVSVYACECDPHHILIDNQEYVAINKITKANPVSAPSESQFDLPAAVVFNLQQIALADDEMVKQPGAAEQYRFIARHILELFTRNP